MGGWPVESQVRPPDGGDERLRRGIIDGELVLRRREVRARLGAEVSRGDEHALSLHDHLVELTRLGLDLSVPDVGLARVRADADHVCVVMLGDGRVEVEVVRHHCRRLEHVDVLEVRREADDVLDVELRLPRERSGGAGVPAVHRHHRDPDARAIAPLVRLDVRAGEARLLVQGDALSPSEVASRVERVDLVGLRDQVGRVVMRVARRRARRRRTARSPGSGGRHVPDGAPGPVAAPTSPATRVRRRRVRRRPGRSRRSRWERRAP